MADDLRVYEYFVLLNLIPINCSICNLEFKIKDSLCVKIGSEEWCREIALELVNAKWKIMTNSPDLDSCVCNACWEKQNGSVAV